MLRAAPYLLLLTLVPLGPPAQAQVVFAEYVPGADGTLLAVDTHLPPDWDGEQLPALLELTRYWRGRESASTGERFTRLSPLDDLLLENGYALVKVDVRGTGASFGTRLTEYGPLEVADGKAIVQWVVEQAWSSGAVGAYGTSYSGTTAELLAASGHPAVKAVIPGWSDFDVYRSPARPYGLLTEDLIRNWSQLVGLLDDNDTRTLGASVCRVDEDVDGELLATAVAEHAGNVDVYAAMQAAVYRDDEFGRGPSLETASSIFWRADIEASEVPMLVFASWFDAGVAAGALRRFRTYSNSQHLVLLASSHGGATHASPYTVSRSPLPSVVSEAYQFNLRLAFLDHHLKGSDNGVADWPLVRYFNMGSEEMLESEVWPPPGTRRARWSLGAGHELFPGPSASLEEGLDRYEVDFGVGTGKANRWATQLGNPVLGLDDRAAMDARMLTYTAAPLKEHLQISGTPTVTLWVRSDRADGAFLVYLEDIDQQGRVRYLTEGGLRALHRRLRPGASQHDLRTYARADAAPLVPGEWTQLHFELWPLSVLVHRGHRLRLAIAGADADAFERVPAEGPVTIEVGHGGNLSSSLQLPVVEALPGPARPGRKGF